MTDSPQQPLTFSSHHNQSLFSDHYLDEILRRSESWRQAIPQAQAFLAWLRDLYAQEKEQLAHYNEDQLEDKWFKPIFAQLGYEHWEGQAVIPGWQGGIKKPDFFFFPDAAARHTAVTQQNTATYAQSALAVCEVKQWGVNLSKKTGSQPIFADQNPMYQIDTYLSLTGLAWGVLSNGRHWRLLHKSSSRTLETYFEVDLLAALAQPDETKATAVAAYFWLFFRQAALRPDGEGRVFLEDALTQSRDYAIALEADLRDNAYRALEQLIIGFFAGDNNLDSANPAHRTQVYQNSLYLLYRLLFIFYGESRALLPIAQPLYQEQYALQQLARQIDQRRSTLNSLPTTGKSYWNRLRELFRLISGVDAQLNADLGVPRYNGGLFDPAQHPFLEQHFVGDRALALAIDYLATRRIILAGGKPEYQRVDYRTLDVRQLGSIYEGLLEYKVAVATEEMVTISQRGVETWVPLAQRGKAKSYGDRRQPGELFLTTDKGERKATGSYYTPDYIVEYIVANTLGPLVAQARERVRAQVRQTGRLDAAARQQQSADLFIKEIFRLNVLDPAMGSGHFLVEATNYLARVLATDEYVQVVGSGRLSDPQGCSVTEPGGGGAVGTPAAAAGAAAGDDDLLYWKRRVVEACIYGVDKNPMAVELAKLSLWLKTAAADKPLSFLDHHLQCGDSLIGAWLADLERAPTPTKPDRSSETCQVSFTLDLGLAVKGVATIERLPTLDIETVHAKEAAWRNIQQTHVARWRRLADLWVSAFFGNKMSAAEYRALAERLQGRESLLSEEQTAHFLNHTAVTDNDYFHWELAFPEVFFDEYGNTRGAAAGFDAVIGNPPWGGEIDTDTYAYLKITFAELHQRLPDTMKYFFGTANKNIKQNGLLGQILTNVVLFAHEYTNLRRILFEDYTVHNIINLGDGIFPQVTAPSCIVIAEKTQLENTLVDIQDLRSKVRSDNLLSNLTPVTVAQNLLREIPNHTVVGDANGLKLLTRLYELSDRVIDLASEISLGVHTGANSAFVLTQEEARQKNIEEDVTWSLLTGSDIDRFSVPEKVPHVILYVEWDFDAQSHPNTILHLANFRDQLAQRREAKQGKMPWYSLHWPRNRPLYKSPKIICRQTADTLIVTIDPYDHCALNSTIIIKPNSQEWSPYFWASVLNSKLIGFVYALITQEEGRTFAEVKPVNLRKLPIRVIEFTTPQAQRTAVLNTAQTHYRQGDYPAVLALAGGELGHGRNDTVHDILAFLAEQMISLNKEKQAALEAFWLDLEGVSDGKTFAALRGKGKQAASLVKAVAAVRPFLDANSRSSHTLDASLNWNEEAFKGFVKELAGSVSGLSKLVQVYRDHAPGVATLSQRLAATDRLIDQIVYQLYGLTATEIAIVEGAPGQT